MPGFCFNPADKQKSLLDRIIVQGNVLTMYFNFGLAFALNERFGVDIRLIVQRTDRNGKQFTFIHENDKEHDSLHEEFPSATQYHHHFKHTSAVTMDDITHLVVNHQSIVSEVTKNKGDVCFITKEDFINLYDAFELYVKFSTLKKSQDHLEIHFKTALSSESYLPRLKYILDTADVSPTQIIKVNAAKTIYYLPYFWLRQIGNAKKELAQNLNLDEKDFLPAAKKC